MANKIKPCPFCGGKAKVYECREELPFSEERNSFFVCCTVCGCQPFHFSEVCLYYKKDFEVRKKQLRTQAIQAWNRRANNDL